MTLASTCTHYYKFDANANDSVGAINGSVTGATNAAGKINNGYTFVSASSQYIAFGTTALGTGDVYTISLWFKSSTGATQHIISRENSGTGGEFHIRLESDGHIDWQNYSSGGGSVLAIHASAANWGDGNWHHLVCVQRGSTAELYVDNTSRGTDAASSTTAWTGSIQTYVGRIATNTSSMFNGQIDEIGIWATALTTTEIATLYNSGTGLQYPFSTGYSKVVNGISAYSAINGVAVANISKVNGV